MRWPRMHGLPNRTSGSVVIRSRSESWTAGIYTPYSYCIAVLTRANRLTRRRFPWAHVRISDEQIDRNLEELGQSFGLRLTDRPPSIQNLGGCTFVPSTGEMSLCCNPRSSMSAFSDSLGDTRGMW